MAKILGRLHAPGQAPGERGLQLPGQLVAFPRVEPERVGYGHVLVPARGTTAIELVGQAAVRGKPTSGASPRDSLNTYRRGASTSTWIGRRYKGWITIVVVSFDQDE